MKRTGSGSGDRPTWKHAAAIAAPAVSSDRSHGEEEQFFEGGCFAFRRSWTPLAGSGQQRNQRQQQQQQPTFTASSLSASFSPGSIPGRSLFGTAPTSRGKEETPEFIIANELKELSLRDRDLAYEEIHGVAPELLEPEDFVLSKMTQLEKEIRKVTAISVRRAYDRCAFLNPKYVKSRDFQLLFLRADQYNAAKATRRMMDHFTKKLELFGYDLLTRDIRWEDLTKEDIRSVKTGAAQFYPTVKDRTGRAIFTLSYAASITNATALSHSRAVWYTIMTCVQLDVETQRKGIAAIIFSHGATSQEFLSGFAAQQHTAWVNTCLPFRISAMHFCMQENQRSLQQLFSLVTILIPKEVRTRIKLHYGSLTEVRYALNTFGIPNESLSLDEDGQVRDDIVEQRSKELRALERLKLEGEDELYQQNQYHVTPDSLTPKLYHPNSNDILLGRGRPYQYHPGNHIMMDLVAQQKPKHDQGSRSVKKQITEHIIKQIDDAGGRFLKRIEKKAQDAPDDEGAPFYPYWIEVDHGKAHEKVAMAFRNMTRKISKETEAS